MTSDTVPNRSGMFLIKAAALFLGIGAISAMIWFVATDFARRVEELASARTDSVQWTLSQVEVEYLMLDHALQYASNGGTDILPELRRQYDIFYSRIDTLRSSPLFEGLRNDPSFQPDLMAVWHLLQETVGLIDGPDDALIAAAAPLESQFEAIHPQIRAMGLHGITFFAEESDATREGIALTLKRVALITLVLVVVLLGMVFVLWRSFTVSQSHAQDARISGERMAAVVSTALDAVVVSDRTGRIIEFNGGAEEIFGYRRDEVLMRTIADVIIPEPLRAAHRAGLQRHLETGARTVIGAGRLKLEALRKDGTVFPVELSISTTTRSDGEEIFVSFLRDITKRVATEKELLEARDNALAGERAKDQLLAVMSHEMRTPLNGMLGTLELLEDTNLTDRQRKFLSIINSSGQVLLQHVNDVLDIARLESGKMVLDLRPVDLNAVIREVVDGQQTLADRAGNRIDLALLPEMDRQVMGDPLRLRQILLNLVGNAVKFTQDGAIHITAERLGYDNMIEICVTDTGIGIPTEDIERVFNDFVTLDTTYGRQTAGTGLGLGIARRMARAMGGEIGVESEPGDGSLFWVRLPLPPADAAIPDSGSTRPVHLTGPPLRILVVEDNEINRLVVREMLEGAGHHVEEAADGAEGADAARRTRFDLILMDISMPRMDGIAATQRIRSEGGASSRAPIIALTAHALADEITRFREAGMDHALTKPISRRMLQSALDFARGKPGAFASAPTTTEKAASGALDRARLDAMAQDVGEDRTAALIAAFLDEADTAVADIATAADQTPQDLLTRIHALAGSAAVFGAQDLHRWLSDAETMGKSGQIDRLRADLPAIASIWRDTRAEFLRHQGQDHAQ